MKLMPVVCPQCGAKLKLPEGTKKTNCQFCGTDIILDKGEVVIIHKEDVEGKAARLLSAAEKYWDTWKFQEMRVACGQLIELDPDNPVCWLYNAISASGLNNTPEFERSMDEARKLSAQKMDSEQSKFFRQKVDWAFNNLLVNVLKYVAAKDDTNVAAYGHMMAWLKPEDPLGWFYSGYALAGLGRAQAIAAKRGVGQASAAQAIVEQGKAAMKQAWLLYDKNPDDESGKKFKELVGKQLSSARWGRVASIIGAIGTGIACIVMSVVFYFVASGIGMLQGEDAIFALIFILIPLIGPFAAVFTILGDLVFLATKNERNFI